VLKDLVLSIECFDMWKKFSEIAPQVRKDCETLELAEFGQDKEKTTAYSAVISSWQGRRESNPRKRFWRPLYYHYTTPLCGVCVTSENS
jgi:hypothetical protein